MEQLRAAASLPKRVAVVHDWLPEVGGAERVLGEILNVLPQADVFSLLDFIPASERAFLQGKRIKTSFLQKMPGARRFYRAYLPLMPLAVESFDLSAYDLILSSSYAVAKGLLSGPDQLHLCYCHSPMRYVWDLQEQYLRQTGLNEGLRGFMARALLHYIRLWDCRTPNGVDAFAANSRFVSRRIWKVYRRKSRVIFPPVGLDFAPSALAVTRARAVYVSLGRLVPYKRVDLLIEAFRAMPERTLHIIGDGPERRRLASGLPSNVRLLGRLSEAAVAEALQAARALVFAAEEDFGIVPVEAQAAGTPVIAYGKGGACETVVHGVTGVLFREQSARAIVEAVEEADQIAFDGEALRGNARRFSPEVFRSALKLWVEEEWASFVRSRPEASCP
ncbi:MAG: Glycosyltransferase involved in cell wall bisynthesis [Verrucomicrobia bacterium]|nr:MAG: Glycosyltransferase involved in cell wall bisynthesis [Verrucomicrobiota bacterium]